MMGRIQQGGGIWLKNLFLVSTSAPIIQAINDPSLFEGLALLSDVAVNGVDGDASNSTVEPTLSPQLGGTSRHFQATSGGAVDVHFITRQCCQVRRLELDNFTAPSMISALQIMYKYCYNNVQVWPFLLSLVPDSARFCSAEWHAVFNSF